VKRKSQDSSAKLERRGLEKVGILQRALGEGELEEVQAGLRALD
jgi:hypothetical protein